MSQYSSTDYIYLLYSRVQNSGLGGLRHNTVLLIIYIFFILGYRTLVWEVYVTIQFY